MDGEMCRELIITRLRNMPFNHALPSSEGNIRAHHLQFAPQQGWPRLNHGDPPVDYQRPRPFSKEELDTGRRLIGLTRLKVFWDHGTLRWVQRPEEPTCLGWSMARCMTSVQANRSQILAAEAHYVENARPLPVEEPTYGGDILGELF